MTCQHGAQEAYLFLELRLQENCERWELTKASLVSHIPQLLAGLSWGLQEEVHHICRLHCQSHPV